MKMKGTVTNNIDNVEQILTELNEMEKLDDRNEWYHTNQNNVIDVTRNSHEILVLASNHLV